MGNETMSSLRNHFLQTLYNNMNHLPREKKINYIKKILLDVEDLNIFEDEIDWEDDKWFELEYESEVEFNIDNKKTSDNKKYQNEDIGLNREKLIRDKRIELSQDSRSGVILEGDEMEEYIPTINPKITHGRSPLHEAIAMRDIESIKKYIKENKYLDAKDNNGNTPYQMAYQEGYEEVVNLFKEFK